jgi:hypothetical protein
MASASGRLPLATAVALALSGCVIWPEGSGPGALAVPIAAALALCDQGEAVLIDVRSPEAYARGHVPGAVNIAATDIESQTTAVRKMGRLPILYCG